MKLRHLFLGRKAMTNLDSVLKSRDITLPTKVSLAKVMVFLVIMYGCKSWTIKKSECQRIDALELGFGETLERPLDCKIKPVNTKGNQPWIFTGRTMMRLMLQYFGHLMQRVDSSEKTLMLGKIEGRRRRGQQRMRWLDGITDSIDTKEEAPGDGEGQRSLASCSPWGCRESDTTEWPNNNQYLEINLTRNVKIYTSKNFKCS